MPDCFSWRINSDAINRIRERFCDRSYELVKAIFLCGLPDLLLGVYFKYPGQGWLLVG